jgi:hypothetical protein
VGEEEAVEEEVLEGGSGGSRGGGTGGIFLCRLPADEVLAQRLFLFAFENDICYILNFKLEWFSYLSLGDLIVVVKKNKKMKTKNRKMILYLHRSFGFEPTQNCDTLHSIISYT